MVDEDPLIARAAAVIAECKTLISVRQFLLEEMAEICQRRRRSANDAANRVRLSERKLLERYPSWQRK